jgi:hypothetical protein
MADNFDMKQFLAENQMGPYAKAKVNEVEKEEESKVEEAKEEIEETVDNRTLMAVEKLQDMLGNLKSNTATNSNIPTTDKQGLLDAFSEMEELLEDVGADIEIEMDDTYEINEASNPEGDKLVLRFLQGIAKKFDYPVAQAALFVKERMKSLGY